MSNPSHTVHDVLSRDYRKDDHWRFFLRTSESVPFPDLLHLQKKWFHDFISVYLPRVFQEINPIQDIGGEKNSVIIEDIEVAPSTHSIEYCKKKELTYGWIISWKIKLVDTVKKKTLFSKRANIGILPLLTPDASYVINGVERVVISQIVRSYWIFYSKKDLSYVCKLVPEKGPWLEIFVEKTWVVNARISKSRKFPITAFLRVFWFESDDSIRALFSDVFQEGDTQFIDHTLAKDGTISAQSAAEFIYNKIRPGEIIDPESAVDYIKEQFLSPARIFLGNIARRKINAKLGLTQKDQDKTNIFDEEDIVASMKYLFHLANMHTGYYFDDADHLANKRIRTMGEVLYSHLQPVMKKFVKSVKGKLSVLNQDEQVKLTDIVNFKIIDNAIKSFFATSQLSQFLDHINPLSDIEHKRRITALGPGWLKRETAKFDVRDLHTSHYGRICPIQTPEWQNIWLVLSQALYVNINDEWFLEFPARRVFQEVEPLADALRHRIVSRTLYTLDAKGWFTETVLVDEDTFVTDAIAKKIEKAYKGKIDRVKVKPFLSDQIDYISPEMDEKTWIADLSTPVDEYGNITSVRVAARHYDGMKVFHANEITYIDVNPYQLFSPNTWLIPFVDHNDAVRAMVATSQHKQGVPLVKAEKALVGTGLESQVLRGTNYICEAEGEGEVVYVDAKRVKVAYKSKTLGTKEYYPSIFQKSNQKTCMHQKVVVKLGQKVSQGDILFEWPCVIDGEIALGKNLRVAFLPWEWFNFEDAIVISSRLVKEDELTSIHIEHFEIEVLDTKIGPEETTNDIPWISMNKLKNLDDNGIIRIGSMVQGWDILIGKITPKSEWELTPEEKLIQAIFGDRSKSIKDNSLYLPSGSWGKVIDVVILDASEGDNLMAGIRKKIKVYIAQTRKIEVWDKLSAKHGNKGIISVVVPEEDMPFTADGKPVDMCLNPLWVISRMNIGQIFETHLGYIAKLLGVNFAVPTFSWFGIDEIRDLAQKFWLEGVEHTTLYDWRTGEKYSKPVTVGYMHFLKLNHMVDDKIHARSVGPYSLITQQPLWGKARDGWQRFGEMEVWALEAYSAVHTLQEMITIKSDDILWRNRAYDSIIKGNKPKVLWLPESFNYLVYLMKWLALDVTMHSKEELDTINAERIAKIQWLWLAGITSYDQSDLEGEGDMIEDLPIDDILTTVIEDLETNWDID